MNIGEHMRFLREENGYSLKKVEMLTGIDNGNLSRYERNLNIPNIELCIKLAKLYNVSLDELVGENEDYIHSSLSPTVPELSREEKKLLDNFRAMRPDLQAVCLNMSKTLLQTPNSITEKTPNNRRDK